jgi:uncharacterized protein DUF4145
MLKLHAQLPLNRCPHCNVDRPLLTNVWRHESIDYAGGGKRSWGAYQCNRCGSLILCAAPHLNAYISEQYPPNQAFDDEAIPKRALAYLEQAVGSLHAPAGAVMLAASAVDAMLKAKSYKDGSLHSRINQAVKDHLITEDMGKWAHEVRLDANDQRHVDEGAPLPTEADARRIVEFAKSLAMFLFVLPAMVNKGIKDATAPTKGT